jgi:hypothetical protein
MSVAVVFYTAIAGNVLSFTADCLYTHALRKASTIDMTGV